MIPAQPGLLPTLVALDEGAQRVAALAHLFDRVDHLRPARCALPPGVAVVPYAAALDLDADDACAFHGDDEVDLVVFLVVGDALADDDEVVGPELFVEGPPDRLLPVVDEPGFLGQRDRHRLHRGPDLRFQLFEHPA